MAHPVPLTISEDSSPQEGEEIAVAELAGQLGVSLPVLSRVLRHPTFADHVRRQEATNGASSRATKVVSLSVVPDIERMVRELGESAAPPAQEAVPEPPKVQPPEAYLTIIERLVAMAETRAEEQEAIIRDLRRDKEHLLSERDRFQSEADRLHLVVMGLEMEMQQLRAALTQAEREQRMSEMP